MNNRSNDDLARLLYHPNGTPPKPPSVAERKQLREPAPFSGVASLGNQQWTLGERRRELGPVQDWEERALFAALVRGTTANLSRQPTVAEAMFLTEQVNKARELVRFADQAIHGKASVNVDHDLLVFNAGQSLGSDIQAA